jgi:hypothetical protein
MTRRDRRAPRRVIIRIVPINYFTYLTIPNSLVAPVFILQK